MLKYKYINCSEVNDMDMEKTTLFHVDDIEKASVLKVIKEVYYSLEEKGYNPINQLVGYLISGDPGYISSYQDARKKIIGLDRSKIVEVLLKDFAKDL